jgi:predicted membrane channel-forming protein YqfA (hemolysin III family)
MRWLLWLRIPSLRTGLLTGIFLSGVFIGWLEIANRVADLDRFAELRNLVAGAVLILILATPVLRFRNHPGKLIVAGLTAWTLLSLTYVAAELHFTLLESRMGAFHIFVLGAVCYGFVAVLDWVFLMCAGVHHQHIIQSREATASAGRQRTH